jgi:hypothetical protein
METEDNRVSVVGKKVSPMIEAAEKITAITTDAEVVEATEVLSKLNKALDMVTEEKEKITKPLNEALKNERARWKPMEIVFEGAVARLRALLSKYQTDKVKKQREEEAKIMNRVGEGKGHIKAETAIRKLGEVEVPLAKVETNSGSLAFREDKVLKITDEKLVPDKYWIIDEKLLLADLKKGETVPGAEIELIQTPVNRR